jgi:hypothetical protein
MQRVKNQHYVSQFCLRRFTMDGTRTWVFDKPTKRSFPRNVDEIASEERFYDLSPKFSQDFQVMEKALGELETYTAPAFDHLLNDLEQKRGFNHQDKPLRQAIATFIAIQDIRTRLFRDQYMQKHGAIIQEIERRGITIPPEWKADVSDERVAFEHARFIFSKEYRQAAVGALMHHIWLVGRNETDQPLYFSDAPVTRYAHVPLPCSGAGLATVGVQIDFPISSKYILMMYERTHFGPMLADREGKMLALNDEGVKAINTMQIAQSRRQIYCAENKFDLVLEYAQSHPELFDPDRPRFQIM